MDLFRIWKMILSNKTTLHVIFGTLWMINQSKISECKYTFHLQRWIYQTYHSNSRMAFFRSNSYCKLDSAVILTRIKAFSQYKTLICTDICCFSKNLRSWHTALHDLQLSRVSTGPYPPPSIASCGWVPSICHIKRWCSQSRCSQLCSCSAFWGSESPCQIFSVSWNGRGAVMSSSQLCPCVWTMLIP